MLVYMIQKKDNFTCLFANKQNVNPNTIYSGWMKPFFTYETDLPYLPVYF
jgi:hypothetical protein